MELIKLSDQKILHASFSKLYVILDDEGVIPFSVNAWLIHICRHQASYKYTQIEQESNTILGHRKKKEVKRLFGLNPLEERTIVSYVGHVFRFLEWLNQQRKKNEQLPTIHSVHQLSALHINEFLNEALPKTGVKIQTVTVYSAAILSMMNFFHAMNWSENLTFSIHGPTISKIAENNTSPLKKHYISRSWRSKLIQCCTNQRDRLILRMGAEVGLRAMENCGLLLHSHVAKEKKQKGLLALFHELEKYPTRNTFEYLLNGRFAKRGKSRLIYFDRELLTAMRHYYETERTAIAHNAQNVPDSLFLNEDNNHYGTQISETRASLIFSKYAKELEFFDSTYSYHDLRHSFATELYHTEFANKGSQNTALLEVQTRLGHANIKSTEVYVQLRQTMLSEIENILGEHHG